MNDTRTVGSEPGAAWFDPTSDLCRVAAVICERAWRGLGVRVYRWPDGTIVVVGTDSKADMRLQRSSQHALIGTYCRAGALSDGILGNGPMQFDVLDQLRWLAAQSPFPHECDDARARASGSLRNLTPARSKGAAPASGSFLAAPHAGCTAAKTA